MTALYPLLEELVGGRDVAVVAKNPKCRSLRFPGQVVVRFNNDEGEADIWCTVLHRGMNQGLHDHCQLVVIPKPETEENIEQIRQLDSPITKPIQFEDESHFLSSVEQLGGMPTTGFLVLAMLSRTSLRSCTLYGFDSHLTPDPRVDMKGFAIHHKPVRELRLLRQFLKSRPRFRVGAHCSLYWPELVWYTWIPLRLLVREVPAVWAFFRKHGFRSFCQRFYFVAKQRLLGKEVPEHEFQENLS